MLLEKKESLPYETFKSILVLKIFFLIYLLQLYANYVVLNSRATFNDKEGLPSLLSELIVIKIYRKFIFEKK